MPQKIKGGYYIKARRIKDSTIAHSPPYVREIWDYLLREANHKDVKYAGFEIKRGQLFKSYKEIRQDLCWYVGYRKEQYNENQMKKGMRYLVKELMISTMKEPRGVLITIYNYDYFQDPKNYERTNERSNERTNEEPMKNQSGPSINKNEKNGRMEEEIKTRFLDYVDLLPKEFETLKKKYGAVRADRAIEILNDYFVANIKRLKKYTSHYGAINSWVMGKVLEQMPMEGG